MQIHINIIQKSETPITLTYVAIMSQQKKRVCVCVCVCVCVRACERACVRACVCVCWDIATVPNKPTHMATIQKLTEEAQSRHPVDID